MLAAVYLRQSIDHTGEGLAVARQREDCLRLCASKGWDPVEYVDNDQSATKGRRPAYTQMLEDIGAGSVRAVIAWDLDRLHRQPRELEDFIDLAERSGIALATVGGEADLATDNGRLFARIKGAVARAEVERKAARQRRANDQRAERGMPSKATGRRFGFEPDGITHRAEEAAVIRQVYADVLAGKSQRSIAADLNARGVRTSRGGTWTQSNLRVLLMRASNAGLLTHRGEMIGTGAWEPIVSEETYRAALALVTDPTRRRSGRTPMRLLTRAAHCGVCGQLVHSTGTGGVRQYVCRTGKHVSRRADSLEHFVTEVVIERLSRPDVLTLLTAADDGPGVEFRREAEQLRSRLESLAVEFADGELTGAQLRAATQRLRGRLAEVERRQADAGRARVLGPFVGAEDVRAEWERLPAERQRAVIVELMTVTLLPKERPSNRFRPDTVLIEWKGASPATTASARGEGE